MWSGNSNTVRKIVVHLVCKSIIMSDEVKLTGKQEMFCQEYVVDLNGTQAAIRAGYSQDTAAQIASENLTKPHIYTRICELQKDKLEKLHINQEWVLQRLVDVSDRCMQKEQVMTWDFEEKCFVPTGEWKFDSLGATKATELIGKHIGIFEKDNKQKVPDTVSPEILAAIAAKLNS